MSGKTATPAAAPAPSPADVGIVAALPIEISHFIDHLGEVRKYKGPRLTVVEGTLGSKIVAVVASGIGQNTAAAAANVLLAGHRPRWILSVGFAGALNPALARNTVIVPEAIVDRSGTKIHIELPNAPDSPFATGTLLTVDAVVRTAAEKVELHVQTGADLIDMESLAVARLCAERSIRFLDVRVISDDAASDLPPELLTLVGPTGSYRMGAAVGAILKRPSSLGTMLRLRDHAHQAAQALDRALRLIVPSL